MEKHDVRWTSVLRRPKRSGDTNRSSPAERPMRETGRTTSGGCRFCADRSGTEKHDVRWTSVLRRPKRSEDTNRSSPAGLVYAKKVSLTDTFFA